MNIIKILKINGHEVYYLSLKDEDFEENEVIKTIKIDDEPKCYLIKF